MSKNVGQKYIDNLLDSYVGDDEDKDKDKDADNLDVKDSEATIDYDLTNEDRMVRGRFPQLEIIYEKFMRYFRISLSSTIRRVASVNLTSTDMVKFGDFINTLPSSNLRKYYEIQ